MSEELHKTKEQEESDAQPVDKERIRQQLLRMREITKTMPAIDIVAFMRERRRILRKGER